MLGELILDPYMAPNFCTASSRGATAGREVWSILGALEVVPYTPEKNYTYQNHIWTTTFVTKNILCDPPYYLVKFIKIRTDQFYNP